MAKTKTAKKQGKKASTDEGYNTKHFPCSYCDKTFTEERSRDHHLLLHSSNKPFKCSQCPHTFKTKKYLSRHVKAVHSPPSNFQCKYCDKKFHYKSKMEDHIAVHTNSKPHKCKVCGKGFNSTYTLSGHVLIHQNLKPFKCQYCEYACRDSSTLRRHHERHMGIVKRYICDICEKTFSKKSIMLEHVAEVHMNVDIRTVPCNQCDKKFKSRTLLNVHIKAIHKRQLATTCEICGHRLSNKNNMAAHLLTHVDARPYKCTFGDCTKRYKDKSSLKKHSLIHYPEKQLPCKICGKRFTRVIRLKRHEAQHGMRKVRIRRVQCDYCELIFNNKGSLILHMRKKHPRGKRRLFICDMCDFETTNKPSIIGHIKGHYRKACKQCYICQRTYKDERWYKQHLLQAHNTIECSGTPTFDIDVKAEPLDVDALPEFELFEIEKEELLEELNSINNDAGREIIDAIEQNVISREASPATDQNLENPEENTENIAQVTESLSDNTGNKELRRQEQSKVVETDHVILIDDENQSNRSLSVNDNITRNTENSIDTVDNSIEKTQYIQPSDKKRLENGDENQHKNKVVLVNNSQVLDSNKGRNRKRNAVSLTESVISHDSITKEKKSKNVPKESLKKMKRSNGFLNNDHNDSNTVLTDDDAEIQRKNSRTKRKVQYKNNQSNIDISLVNKLNNDVTNTNLIKENNHKLTRGRSSKKESKNNSKDINGDKSNLKHTDRNKSRVHDIDMTVSDTGSQDSQELQSEDEPNEDMDSRPVLSKDLTRVTTQKQKRNSSNNFVVENMLKRSVGSNDKREELDKECQLNAKKYLDKLLRETREKREVKLIEKTRMEYNERIQRARDLRKEKVSIKYFDKNKKDESNDTQINNDNEINDMSNDQGSTSNTSNSQQKYNDNKTEDNVIESENNNSCNSDTGNTNSSRTNPNLEGDTNIDAEREKDTETSSINKEVDGNEERHSQEEDNSTDSSDVREKEIDRRSSLRRKRTHNDDSIIDEGAIEESGKIKINTHQCYVCFKLFDTKDKLLDHCKDHFDICNATILKKCPLCDYATKLNIVQHMKTEHNIQMTIPNKRIREKECLDNGSKYCYNVDSSEIKNIDIIPSVKHLNKQAYIDIDEKNRKLKDTGIAKTKLVKKGNEWIVERKTTKIDNVEDLILPQFEVDEIMSIKIDTKDYLGRIQKLSRLAKMYKKKMVFPCEDCEKICQSFCALKLHVRRHDDNKKPFKKKVWKHKIKDMIVPTKDKVTSRNHGKKYRRVNEIDRVDKQELNKNRYKNPKPVVNKHKCDPELIKFYEANIKGGDIEFWQFLKIFNKMSRENVNDFDDLVDRTEFGIHEKQGTSINDNNETTVNDNGGSNERNDIVVTRDQDPAKNVTKNVRKIGNSKFNRVIRISRKDYKRRNELKQQLREKIAKGTSE